MSSGALLLILNGFAVAVCAPVAAIFAWQGRPWFALAAIVAYPFIRSDSVTLTPPKKDAGQ
jgi:hypothetical protein